ncbi:hypothetical protein VYU27_009232 [Nannochloropsis oceanica]
MASAPLPLLITSAVLLTLIIIFVLFFRVFVSPAPLNLKGKVVLITGGSSGIGKAVAKEALGQGAQLILLARSMPKLEEAQRELYASLPSHLPPPSIILISQDVSEGVAPLADALCGPVKAVGGKVDVLINCAGTSVSGAFDALPEAAFHDMYKANVLGSICPTRAVLPYMKDQRSGSIVFVSSQAGQVGIWGYSAYSASKFALRGLAQALQMEVHPFNIFVSIVYPPDTDTPGFETENESKPTETALISGPGNVFEASHVARDLLSGVKNRTFSITTGLDGFMLGTLSCGMEPVFAFVPALLQCLLCSLFRFVSLFYIFDFYRVAHKCHAAPPSFAPSLPPLAAVSSGTAAVQAEEEGEEKREDKRGGRWKLGLTKRISNQQ